MLLYPYIFTFVFDDGLVLYDNINAKNDVSGNQSINLKVSSVTSFLCPLYPVYCFGGLDLQASTTLVVHRSPRHCYLVHVHCRFLSRNV